LDLASSIPFNLFWYIATGAPAGGRGGDVIRFLPCLRIYRLPQTFHIMSRLAKETFWSYLTLRIAKLTLVSSHLGSILYGFYSILLCSSLWFSFFKRSRTFWHMTRLAKETFYGATSHCALPSLVAVVSGSSPQVLVELDVLAGPELIEVIG
jgi:hypothetical protein